MVATGGGGGGGGDGGGAAQSGYRSIVVECIRDATFGEYADIIFLIGYHSLAS